MADTKERILLAALKLFAENGYEAVSVRDIAGELDMTKAALYKHYRNKRDIFQSILERMEQRDAEQARLYDMPEGAPEDTAEAWRSAGEESITGFGKAMFRYWTEDGFASRFRRMLTLEQYRDPEMGRLYQQYLAAGPLGYMTDLFRAMALPRAQEEAARFYAPMFLLYSVYDASEDKAAVLALLDGLLDEAGEHLKEIRKEGQDHAG